MSEGVVAMKHEKNAVVAYVGKTIDRHDTSFPEQAWEVLDGERGGYVVRVHVADPSYFVRKDTQVLEEALQSICTRYVPCHTEHMLPTDILSQVAFDERRASDAVTLTITLDKVGSIDAVIVERSTFRNLEKMNFSQAEDILKNLAGQNGARNSRTVDFEHFSRARKLAQCLVRRYQQETLFFENFAEEMNALFDAIDATDSLDLERINYAIMILANHAFAQFCFTHEVPIIYKEHRVRVGAPSAEVMRDETTRIVKFSTFLHGDSSGEEWLSFVLPRAQYSTVAFPHVALNCGVYAEITTPCRSAVALTNMLQVVAYSKGADLPFSREELVEIVGRTNECLPAIRLETEGHRKKRDTRDVFHRLRRGESIDHLTPNFFHLIVEDVMEERGSRTHFFSFTAFSESYTSRLRKELLFATDILKVLVTAPWDTASDALRDMVRTYVMGHPPLARRIYNRGKELFLFPQPKCTISHEDARLRLSAQLDGITISHSEIVGKGYECLDQIVDRAQAHLLVKVADFLSGQPITKE